MPTPSMMATCAALALACIALLFVNEIAEAIGR